MIDCTCGFAKDIPEERGTCPNCGIDVTPLHRLKGIPRSCYEEGIRFADAGNLDKALERLMASISLDGGSAVALLAVGNVYAQKHLYAEALRNYERASELDPNNEDVKDAIRLAAEARKKDAIVVTRLRLYAVIGAALVVGLIVTPSFEHFTRQRKKPIDISALAIRVSQDLHNHPSLENLNLDVSSVHNTLNISGEVPSRLQKDLVVELAKNAVGDQIAITSDILVRPTTTATQTTSGFVYTVKAGDTLTALAERFYGDGNEWQRIFDANKGAIADPHILAVRQVLRIPSR
jgi:nucleoid-associated protein YgaU